MKEQNNFDVIVLGGSYAGLSAAMALGRSLRRVLIIDSGKPCNRQTPHSHNFLTQDGETPEKISAISREQALAYSTVSLHHGIAVSGRKNENGFEIVTDKGESFGCRKLIIATGIVDEMPDIPGFAGCWGISVLHCPYCHGYEVSGKTLGVLGNGDMVYEFCKLISNWSKNLIVMTNGKSALSEEQTRQILHKGFRIIETPIERLEHKNGYIDKVHFIDGRQEKFTAVFARTANRQHCDIPAQLNCAFTEHGLIQVDEFQKTSVGGVYAAGDSATHFRAVSIAVATGTKAGAVVNKELIDEDFKR